ncbi:hypothetical protein MRX96_026607 [Rhipicephalus microplus]
MMEESVDRSVDRQRWSLKNSKLVVTCFAVTILMLFVVSAVVLYKYVVQPERLVAESNKSKKARVRRSGQNEALAVVQELGEKY